MKGPAEALKQALKQERTRIEVTESTNFKKARNTKASPRSLQTNTFFTPHLHTPHNKHISHPRGIVSDYAVIVNMGGKPTVSRTQYNPTRFTQLHLPPNLPPSYSAPVHKLESEGFRFNGVNKDILVFERLYNQKQRDRRWASRSAAVIAGSVLLLTSALFAGEYLINK